MGRFFKGASSWIVALSLLGCSTDHEGPGGADAGRDRGLADTKLISATPDACRPLEMMAAIPMSNEVVFEAEVAAVASLRPTILLDGKAGRPSEITDLHLDCQDPELPSHWTVGMTVPEQFDQPVAVGDTVVIACEAGFSSASGCARTFPEPQEGACWELEYGYNARCNRNPSDVTNVLEIRRAE